MYPRDRHCPGGGSRESDRRGAFRQTGLFIATLAIALTAFGCSDSSAPGDPNSELNNQLTTTLTQASAGKGLAFFTMPSSDDYANIPQDPRNPITKEKVELGKFLYHETCLTVNPKFSGNLMQGSCASCHHVDAGFQAGVAQGIGTGGIGFGSHGEGRRRDPAVPADSLLDVQPIRSPSALNIAWQTNILWNGQFGANGVNVGTQARWTPGTPKEKNNLGYDGVEIQAIAGQNVHRMDIAKSPVTSSSSYVDLFARAFPGVPSDQRITDENAGLAIAAYERTLLATEAPFQRWLRGDHSAMNTQQIRGAIVFFGKGNCVGCHTGPALNSMAFYGMGMNDLDGPGIYGNDPSKPEHKGRGGFTGRPEDMYHFKVPQIYNLVDSKFYGHGANFHSVRDVVEYKNNGVPQNPNVPAAQLAPSFRPLGLTADEITDLVAFIEQGLRDPSLSRYVPATLPTGFCFPNNDPESRTDRGCK